MSVTEHIAAILRELSTNTEMLEEHELATLAEQILTARHVFVAGAGRSGIAIAGFANRLLHIGKSVSVVGEITSPRSRPGDLLVIGSGSGATDSLLALARKANRNSVRVALITMQPDSAIGRIADKIVVLPGAAPILANTPDRSSIQPMGSAFEQMCFLAYDAIILELMAVLGEQSDSMLQRHADLE